MPESNLAKDLDINQHALIDVLNAVGTQALFLPVFGEQTVTFSQLDNVDESRCKVVLFGDFNWQHYRQANQMLTELEVRVVGHQFVRPSQLLPGAIAIYLNKPLSKSVSTNLMGWAEENALELCAVNDGPKLEEPGLIVMDMDSTAITIECIDEIAKLAGVGDEVAKVTELAMQGELDFAESLRARVKTLTDAPIEVIDKVANNLPLMPGLENLVAELQRYDWKIVIASGGFTYMTEKLKQQLNLDCTVANQLEMADGKLTGQVLGKIVDAQVKADTVNELAYEYNIPIAQTVAMGDGANDLIMMAAANLGVAFHAKPLVRKKADVSVKQGGLDQLLYLL